MAAPCEMSKLFGQSFSRHHQDHFLGLMHSAVLNMLLLGLVVMLVPVLGSRHGTLLFGDRLVYFSWILDCIEEHVICSTFCLQKNGTHV